MRITLTAGIAAADKEVRVFTSFDKAVVAFLGSLATFAVAFGWVTQEHAQGVLDLVLPVATAVAAAVATYFAPNRGA